LAHQLYLTLRDGVNLEAMQACVLARRQPIPTSLRAGAAVPSSRSLPCASRDHHNNLCRAMMAAIRTLVIHG
jgi:hypothetical protein